MPLTRLTTLLCALLLAAASAGAAPPARSPEPEAPTAWVKDPRYWPEPVMDQTPPPLPAFERERAVLVFSKTNGFRDSEQIEAANDALADMADARGWDSFVSENAALFNPDALAQFNVVVLNSISGNVFTDAQRAAFRQWVEDGGGVVALHGSGGDPRYDWDWYVDTLIGAQFIGHTNAPNQFQDATVLVAEPDHPAMAGLPGEWRRQDEWYAFDRVPNGHGTRILARLDEGSYEPAPEHRMGDHPIVWTRCIARGRVFYSALGHKAETYAEPLHLRMIDGAIGWAAETPRDACR
ncbi:ThuA domain-containing protein [Luteimonas sp. A482]